MYSSPRMGYTSSGLVRLTHVPTTVSSLASTERKRTVTASYVHFISAPAESDDDPFSPTGWDSIQAHRNYIGDKERQASVAVEFAEAMRGDVGGLIMEHAVLSVETTLRIIEAPLTEVARLTFSDRASLEKAKPIVDKYIAYANREETVPIAAAFGQTVDLENVEEMKIMFIIGWKTAEVI